MQTTYVFSGLFFQLSALLLFSFLIQILLLLKILNILNLTFYKRKKEETKTEDTAGQQSHQTHKEYVDPRKAAEKMFKNVLLKRSIEDFGDRLLRNIAKDYEIMQAVFYHLDEKSSSYKPVSFYAMVNHSDIPAFRAGEGIPGEAVKSETVRKLKNLPENYRRVESGLGNTAPQFLFLIPLFHEDRCVGLVEFSTFKDISDTRMNSLNYVVKLGGKKLMQFLEKIDA